MRVVLGYLAGLAVYPLCAVVRPNDAWAFIVMYGSMGIVLGLALSEPRR